MEQSRGLQVGNAMSVDSESAQFSGSGAPPAIAIGQLVSDASGPSSPGQLSGLYLALLSCVLLGYALFGKGFAYIGAPPLFIGEAALLAGVVILLHTGCLIPALTTLPTLLLAVTMVWALAKWISARSFKTRA